MIQLMSMMMMYMPESKVSRTEAPHLQASKLSEFPFEWILAREVRFWCRDNQPRAQLE